MRNRMLRRFKLEPLSRGFVVSYSIERLKDARYETKSLAEETLRKSGFTAARLL
jgi:hypothetical protein